MTPLKPIRNWLSYGIAVKQKEDLLAASRNVKLAQIKRLKQILIGCAGAPANREFQLNSKMSPQDFAKSFPVTDFDFWKNWIEIGKSNNIDVLIHEGPYGRRVGGYQHLESTEFPISTAFVNEAARGLLAALGEMYSEMPSLLLEMPSWMVVPPTENHFYALKSLTSGLSESIPLGIRWSIHSNSALPPLSAPIVSRDVYLFAAVASLLANHKMSAVVISSPNILLELANTAINYREVLAATLSAGAWAMWPDALKNVPCPKSLRAAESVRRLHTYSGAESFLSLWPFLKSLYSFFPNELETFSSHFWKLFPNLRLFDFGLWVNEGVITVRIGGKNLLALNSHYYEFEDVSNGNILCAWDLEKEMNVRPIISNSAGLLRCRSKVVLKVKSFLNRCPCFSYVENSVP